MNGSQANFLQSLGWAVLNSLWQMALLWVVYQVITAIFRKSSSSSNSSLAVVLMMAGFTWFAYTFFNAFTTHTAEGNAIAGSALVEAEANPELYNWLQKTLPVASVIYLILLVFPLLHFTRNYRYVQVIRRFGLSKIDVNWRIFVQKISAQMGIKMKVKIWVSEIVSSPVTIGFLKPVILVPLAAINHLTPQQLEAVLLHELSHIRRFDYLLNLLINFIQTLLYFNPFAKAFVRIVEKEREKSCDEMVLQFQYDSHEYASALLTLEKASQSPGTLVVGAAGHKHELLGRIESILGVNKKPFFNFNKLAGCMAGLLCVIALNALFIISKPIMGNKAASFARLFEISESYPQALKEKMPAETSPVAVSNHAAKQKEQPTRRTEPGFETASMNNTDNPDYHAAGFQLVEVPVLKKYQQEQVKEAMEASKKVLESQQWKAFERSVGDVFTPKEKDQLKVRYQREMAKMDWEKFEDKLKLAYNKVDWESVNLQLSNAVNQVRLDSLTHVYTQAMVKLDQVEKELISNDLQVIPDSDLSLQKVETKRQEIQKVLNKLQSTRTKKIVHL